MTRRQPPPAGAADPTPLLTSADEPPRTPNNLRRTVNGVGRGSAMAAAAAQIMRQANGRQALAEPAMIVREAAAEQIEVRQSEWAYSRPIVVLDLLWNSLLLTAALVVLVVSTAETTSAPLRLWIIGYCLQCVLHMGCVCVEYKSRMQIRLANRVSVGPGPGPGRISNGSGSSGSSDLSPPSVDEEARFVELMAPVPRANEDNNTSVAKHLESANTMFSFIWWIIGFYWVSSGGSSASEDAPDLYWLCIAFLALDVFVVVICVLIACLVGIAVCFCLPCIIAILYAVGDEEGATVDDLDQLPRFIYRTVAQAEKDDGEISESQGGLIFECDIDSPEGRALPAEDAKCVICLSDYEEECELRQLRCRHLYHSGCIDKWLLMKATCPLCNRDILKKGEMREDPRLQV